MSSLPSGYQQRRSGVLVPRNYSATYEGARQTRHRRWLPRIQKDSAKVLTASVLAQLRSTARQHYANSGLVRGAFRDVARYLIGHDGIRPQSMAEDLGWARDLELRWQNWLKIADVRGRLHFNQIARAGSVEMDIDGDFGLILTETGGGDMGGAGMAQIQTIRAHRIEDGTNADGRSNAGVIASRVGRTVAFRVKDGDTTTRDIPAQSFILLGDPELSDWVRYPSAIAHGLNIVQDAREVRGHVFDGIKVRTGRALYIKTPTGEVDDDVLDDEINAALADGDLTLEQIQGGEIPRLGPGEELLETSTDFPGQHIMPILEFEYRDFATGYGTPLEVIWKSDLGGPAQRFFLSKFQRRVDERRSLVFIPHLYFRLWGYFVAKEMKRGAVPYREDWWKVRFVPTSPNVSIDVGREAQQNREDMLFGSRTLMEDAGERGVDWEELRDQSEREADDLITRSKALAKKHDITFEVSMTLLSRRTPNGNLPDGAPIVAPTKPLKV